MSGSVDVSALTKVLPSISDSSVKSPFEFANQMSQAQKNALDVQRARSEKIAGELAQQSIDPVTGRFDEDKYKRLLATTPGAAQSAFTSMKDTSALRGAGITQNISINDHVNAAVTAALASDDANIKQAVIEQANRLRAILPPGQVDAALLGLRGDNPAELRKQLETMRVATLPPQQKQDWTYGKQETVTTPGATYITPVPPLRSGQGVVVPHGPAPGDMVEVKDWVDAKGNVVTSGTAGASERTRIVPKSQVPGVSQAGPPQLVPGTGSGTGTGTGSTTTAPAPIPTPPGVSVIPPTYQARPGTPAPAAPVAPAPAVPATSPFGGYSITNPAVAPATPPVVTPPVVAPVVPATPPGMVTSTSVPATTAAEQKASQDLFIADRTALPQRQTQEQNLMHAYDALELVTSGKGTETAAKWRNFLATVGALPPGQVDDVAIYEVGRKYLEKTISDIGNAGGTDTARALAGASNPSVALTNPANLAVLRNDIGKIRQQMAANMTAPDKTTGAGYGKHAGDHASNTDYRGFAWDKYSDGEKAQILKSVGAEGTPPHDALLRAIAMQKAFWPKKGAGPIVPHAEATPTAAPTNALAMAPQQSGNPLLAA